MTKFAASLAGGAMLMAGILISPARSAAENASPVAELNLVSLETVVAPDDADRGDRTWIKHPMIKVTFTASADLGAVEQVHKKTVHISVMSVRDEQSYTHDNGAGAALYNEAGQVTGPDSAGAKAGSGVRTYHFYIGLVPQGFGPIAGNVRDSITSPYINVTEPRFTLVPRELSRDKPMGFKFLGIQGNSNFVRFPEEEFIAAVKAGSP